ncbi:MAG: LLM class F420-dependent oxidoreductase, partial [Anaerolineae bacterium]|nr:LLM class F420-dependent oxidoreductase [Anaerolineae bacterium]
FDDLDRSTNLNVFLLEDGKDPVQATAQVRGARSYEDFTRDAFVMTSTQLTEHIGKLVDLGVNYVITYFPRVAYDHTHLQRFASEVMPAFA